MRPEDILNLLRARPFQPFRISLSDGAEFEVRHPELAIVGRSVVTLGLAGPQGPGAPVEQTIHVSLIQITRTALVDGASAT